MKPEDHFLFTCTRQDFDVSHVDQLKTLCPQLRNGQWDTICTLAQEQGVAPLVYANLSKQVAAALKIPGDVLTRLKKYSLHNKVVKHKMARIFEQVLAKLATMPVDVMVVKGAALNMVAVYEQEWYTISADIDLVIRPRTMAGEAGRQQASAFLETINRRQSDFKEHLEYDYCDHHDVTMNNVLPIDFARMWQEARPLKVGDYNVFVMTPEDMLLAAAINACRKRFFKLKSLCDIAEIVRAYPDLDWCKFTERARRYKCNTIVYTSLLVTRETVGCSFPQTVLADLKVNPLRARLVKRLVDYLCQHASLASLSDRSQRALFGRSFSWPLALTYVTYRWDLLGRKLIEIYKGRHNPH